ncbi:LacI family transcriptional regulator [Wenjunlia tyrosinilytica]|uniref:LacI family transcriptional regulator n=1 Tax=Wenjunlia tyrosinilytica TaxID=1544741 RepID=A0A918E0F4_9ACTN|nr:LacI family transcriptional regulator [Wenjunlia tyrosinilytica]
MVSRVFNADANLRIRDETRQRVLAAAEELSYTPNHAARALRRARVGVLGLAVHDVSNPIYSEIVAGVQRAATEAGYTLMLADADALASDDASFRNLIGSRLIDGLLLQRAGNNADAMVAKIASGRLCTILLNDRTRGPLSSVALDDETAARLATEHLIGLGHSRIGHLAVDGPRSRSQARVRGWRSALRAAGMAEEPELLAGGGHTIEAGFEGMRQLLRSEIRPTAVFAGNALSAVGAATALRQAGLSIPGDISLIGFHDLPFAAHLTPPLTTVRLPLRAMGSRAVELLLEQLDGSAARHEIVRSPAPELIERGSCAPPGRVGRAP